MTDDDALHLLLPILGRRQRICDARVPDREGAAKIAAIASPAIGEPHEAVTGLDDT